MGPLTPKFSLEPARKDDLEALVALRIEAMRESLTALGRFDPVRARARFSDSFEPSLTRHVVAAGERVGFVVVKPLAKGLVLDHLYLHPRAQGRGLGSAVLAQVLAEADGLGLSLSVGALRGSRANRFYLRHGFEPVGKTEWDVYYRRRAAGGR